LFGTFNQADSQAECFSTWEIPPKKTTKLVCFTSKKLTGVPSSRNHLDSLPEDFSYLPETMKGDGINRPRNGAAKDRH